jgi:cytochrome c-type biogenesis protein CcmH
MNKQQRQFALIYGAILALAAMLIPLRMQGQSTDRAKILGAKLMCTCGCNQILTQCNHINCPASGPELKELDALIARGESDDLIIQDFVQQYGQKVLSEPPTTGFNSLAWYIPGGAFVMGLGIVGMLIRVWRRPNGGRAMAGIPHATAATSSHNAQIARAREQADRETEE